MRLLPRAFGLPPRTVLEQIDAYSNHRAGKLSLTTADYGPEAYNFAKDKPLSLLNGSNLLHLLEEHGHQARIDIKAAQKTFTRIAI